MWATDRWRAIIEDFHRGVQVHIINHREHMCSAEAGKLQAFQFDFHANVVSVVKRHFTLQP
jgi:hypothetical protein